VQPEPVVAVDPIYQRTASDCGLAALAMGTALSYRDICKVSKRLKFKAHAQGVWMRDLTKIAKHMGIVLVQRPVAEFAERTGVLAVSERGQRSSDHVVAMFRGVLFDPGDGIAWDPDAYFTHYKRRPTYFLARKDGE
jgi:hypothetical protein